MTRNKSVFHELDTTVITQITIGNDAIVQSNEKCTIAIETKRSRMLVCDVLFVPELAQNLLSVGQLIEYGHAVHLEDKYCKIYDKPKNRSKLIANIKMEKNRNFSLILNISKPTAMKAGVEDSQS